MSFNSQSGRLLVIIAVLVSMLLSLSCSKKSTAPNAPDDIPYPGILDNVTLAPNSGPPGTIVQLIGLDSLPGIEFWSLNIGQVPSAIISGDNNTYYTMIPLYFAADDSTQIITPENPVSLAILYGDITVDEIDSALTVDSLIEAPQVVDNMIDDLLAGVEGLRQLSLAAGVEDTLMQATFMAIEEILVTGENSLVNVINGQSPIAGPDTLHKGIYGAMLANSGFSEMIAGWSDSAVAIGAAAKLYSRNHAAWTVDDEGLALRMQLYSLMKDLGNYAIAGTALHWQYASAILGVVGVFIPVVAQAEFIVSYIVAEIDFIVNKLALGLLPAEVTEFNLEFDSDTIAVGDSTAATVFITAKNNPPNITPLDIVNQVTGGLAFVDWLKKLKQNAGWVVNIEEVWESITTWTLSVIQNLLGTHYNDPTFLDVSLPDMTWDDIQVDHCGLIQMYSPDHETIDPMDHSINGMAGDSVGPINIYMRGRMAGPDALISPTLQAAGYAGGTFGSEMIETDPQTVFVMPTLALEVGFPDEINSGGAGVVNVHAGYYNSDGTTRWAENIDITVAANGGYVETSVGTTDATGQFNTVVHHDSSSSEIEIQVTAIGIGDCYGDTTLTASVQFLVMRTTFPSTVTTGSTNTLFIRTGFASPAGSDTTWQQNVSITISTVGASAGSETGYTDSEGYFETSIQHDNVSSTIDIGISAVHPGGDSITTDISATVNSSPDVLGWYYGPAVEYEPDPYDYPDAFVLVEGAGGEGAPLSSINILFFRGVLYDSSSANPYYPGVKYECSFDGTTFAGTRIASCKYYPGTGGITTSSLSNPYYTITGTISGSTITGTMQDGESGEYGWTFTMIKP